MLRLVPSRYLPFGICLAVFALSLAMLWDD
jgi:hypothetical protein